MTAPPVASLGDHAVLEGPLVALAADLDRRFDVAAAAFGARELRFSPVLPVPVAERAGWLRSFPHLATRPVTLEGDAPLDALLTPAACLPLYDHLAGATVGARRCFGVRSTCFRREAAFRPLERQWAFTMREVVVVGSPGEVSTFLVEAQEAAGALAADLGLEARWTIATDPFFRADSPEALMQRVHPTKRELVVGGDLAIASVNRHRDHFGAAFGITVHEGAPASSACLAFGLERWVVAVLRRDRARPGLGRRVRGRS